LPADGRAAAKRAPSRPSRLFHIDDAKLDRVLFEDKGLPGGQPRPGAANTLAAMTESSAARSSS
jgi:hypothetical protein